MFCCVFSSTFWLHNHHHNNNINSAERDCMLNLISSESVEHIRLRNISPKFQPWFSLSFLKQLNNKIFPRWNKKKSLILRLIKAKRENDERMNNIKRKFFLKKRLLLFSYFSAFSIRKSEIVVIVNYVMSACHWRVETEHKSLKISNETISSLTFISFPDQISFLGSSNCSIGS